MTALVCAQLQSMDQQAQTADNVLPERVSHIKVDGRDVYLVGGPESDATKA